MGLIEDINQPKQTPLHSSAMGRVAGADGSMTGDVGLPLEQRQKIDDSRQYVDKYTSSHIGSTNAYVTPAMRRYKPRRAAKLYIGERDATPMSRRQEVNANKTPNTGTQPPLTKSYQEPSARGYNPYK